MSRSPTSPDLDLRRLTDEGYDVALVGGLLKVSSVPYVRPGAGGLGRGTLVVPLSLEGDRIVGPRQHIAWWVGEEPSDAHGRGLGKVVSGLDGRSLAPGLRPRWMLCNKPRDREFVGYHEFIVSYVALLGVHAAVLDPTVTARVGPTPRSPNGDPLPFRYADTATTRAGIADAAAAIAGQTVGIVGLGGTGSYVLDLVAKCPVGAIHLFDGDRFEQHNAFRCPGAASVDDLRAGLSKVDHLARTYSRMHRRIVPHDLCIDRGTASLLDVLDFAFVCVDDGPARAVVMDRLAERGIPGVDVGMGLDVVDGRIVGAVRTTPMEPQDRFASMRRIPTAGDRDGVYSTNVQIAELNALNAAMAVIAWKRRSGFYACEGGAGHSVFVVETGAMHRGA